MVSVTGALAAPTGMVSGPVQAGEPVQPGKVATLTPDGNPSLTRTDTVADGSLESTTRLRVMVAARELPPVTLAGFKLTLLIASGGGVIVTFLLSGEPVPSDAVMVAEMLEVPLPVAVSTPFVCCWVVEVQAAGMEGSTPEVKALAGAVVILMSTPPKGAGPASVAFVRTFEPPGMVLTGLPLTSSTTNDESGGMATDPPGLSVSGCTSETRLRVLPLDASL